MPVFNRKLCVAGSYFDPVYEMTETRGEIIGPFGIYKQGRKLEVTHLPSGDRASLLERSTLIETRKALAKACSGPFDFTKADLDDIQASKPGATYRDVIDYARSL